MTRAEPKQVVRGWAVVGRDGLPLVRTVGDTPRAAVVNWIVAEKIMMLWSTDTDEYVLAMFQQHAPARGARLAQVEMYVASTEERP
jgi:hypothetical protein